MPTAMPRRSFVPKRTGIAVVLALALVDVALAVYALRTHWYGSSPLLTFVITLYGTFSGIVVAVYGAVHLLHTIHQRIGKSRRRMSAEEIIAAAVVAAWDWMKRPFWLIPEAVVLAALGVYLVVLTIEPIPISVSSSVLAFKWGTDTRIYVADNVRGSVMAIRASDLRHQVDIPIGRSGAATSVGRP